MKMKGKLLAFLLIFFFHWTMGQMKEYTYQRPIHDVTDLWHSIPIPADMFSELSYELSDIRIYGITAQGDTIEAPYILKVNADQYTQEQIDFTLINTTSNEKGHYFTFEVPSEKAVNKLELNFKESNFDWLVTLEGSHDQKEWFTIVDKARIISIKNNQTDYSFTRLTFPPVKYSYLRLFIPKNTTAPTLVSAKMTEEQLKRGSFREYPVKRTTINQKNKQTIADIELTEAVPVSYLKVEVKDTLDYYRPISIQYLSDSINTPNGWKYRYETIASGILSSMESNEFNFRSVISKQLRVTISHNDNQPLQLGSFIIRGNVHELVARFTEPASYMMVYGNPQAGKPSYDIINFSDKIPSSLSQLTTGKEIVIAKEQKPPVHPLFENKWWLWAIMGATILLLGYFSVQMLKKKT